MSDDKDILAHTARMLPESNDAECEANKNAQRPQIELGHHLHDGEYAAMEKCEGAMLDCLERGQGRKAGISVSDAEDSDNDND